MKNLILKNFQILDKTQKVTLKILVYININDFENKTENTLGDAVDDLLDIIKDLLEVKWRIENNSLDDGVWFFKFIFRSHTQQHILDLLNYIKQKKE